MRIKGVLRLEQNDTLALPGPQSVTLTVRGPDNKEVLRKQLTPSPHGTVAVDFNLGSDAALGYYYVEFAEQNIGGSGSFYVEDYKKPEYQVTVKPTAPRVLQGNSIQATVNARYFFGEPVAGAKVTYVVHTSTHYWWDQDEGDDNGDNADADSNDSDNSDDADDTYGQTEQQEHQGILDANGQLTVTLPTRIDPKHTDQDYRIEARVTDAANREVAGHSTVLATYGSFRVSVEPTTMSPRPVSPRAERTAQDYDGKPVQTRVHIAAVLEKWDSVTHERTDTDAGSKDAVTASDGTALVNLALSGSATEGKARPNAGK